MKKICIGLKKILSEAIESKHLKNIKYIDGQGCHCSQKYQQNRIEIERFENIQYNNNNNTIKINTRIGLPSQF